MLHLPRWATDCLKRAEPALATSTRPLVLWERQRGAMKIVALDEAASATGLFAGQNLSDARAMVPDLEPREINREYLTRTFSDFAGWHSNASPIVSILTDHAAWGDLVLDITGVSHLFGGEETMLATLAGRLETAGFSVCGAIASTVGAAWALAHFDPGQIIAEGAEDHVLSRLPVAGLRLEAERVEGLKQFGLHSIGQLYQRDRRALQARFGVSLLVRLDQTLGWIEEKITPQVAPADHLVERRFPEPIGLIEDVLMTAHDLAIALALQLERAGIGAQSFHLFLYRVDHKVMTLTVNAARATRDAAQISRLFSYRAERLEGEYDAGFGIDMIRLAASEVSPIEPVQTGAFGHDDGASNLLDLYDRMSSRLGAMSVVRVELVNSYMPEQAVTLEPAIAAASPTTQAPPVVRPRPVRLLPHPEPITVIAEVPDAPPSRMIWRRVAYRFAKASGPERLGAEWQQGTHRLQFAGGSLPDGMMEHGYVEGQQTRDYYVAEDESGRRFWLFRLGLLGIATEPRWFLHGFFA